MKRLFALLLALALVLTVLPFSVLAMPGEPNPPVSYEIVDGILIVDYNYIYEWCVISGAVSFRFDVPEDGVIDLNAALAAQNAPSGSYHVIVYGWNMMIAQDETPHIMFEGDYLYTNPDNPPVSYNVKIDGEELTSTYIKDFYTSCWSFDGQHTLSIAKDFTAGFDTVHDFDPFINRGRDAVDNYGHAGLVIDFVNYSEIKTFEGPQTVYYENNPRVLHVGANTTIQGAGGGKLYTENEGGAYSSGTGCAVEVDPNQTLTVQDTDIQVESKYGYPLRGGSGAKLVVNHAGLTAECISEDLPAISGFSGGIELSECEIVEPEGGYVKDGAIVDADGNPAEYVRIAAINYGIAIDGTAVKVSNRSDILGNGIFSYDGKGVLSVSGSYTGANGQIVYHQSDGRWVPYDIINNTGTDDLTIRFTNPVTLTPTTIHALLAPPYPLIHASKDTKITGEKCTFDTSNELFHAIYVDKGATLTIEDTEIATTRNNGYGILGNGSHEKLVIIHASVDVSDSYNAISGFTGGIELIDCRIVEPEGGYVKDGAIVKADGSKANHVVIEPTEPGLGLRITGVEVTESNRNDVLGNGVFSFDGDHTLTIQSKFWTQRPVPVVENYGVDGLVIQIPENAAITQASDGPVFHLLKNTTFTGGGILECYGEGEGILADGDITVTVKDLTLRMTTTGNTFFGSDLESRLIFDHCTATLEAGDNAEGAVVAFNAGIQFKRSRIAEPTEGFVAGGTVWAQEGEAAYTVIIEPLENPFVDVVEGKYYYDSVLWAYYHDPRITGGTDDTHFSPNKTCTREQIVTFLWKAKGAPEPKSNENPFTDVKSNKYYYKAVLWAVENGITGGVTKTAFGVGQPCKREQAMTFLWKAMGSPGILSSTLNPFTDVKEGKYYYTAVLWAVENGVTGGTTKTTFGVGKTCTRGQIVTFLYKAFAN